MAVRYVDDGGDNSTGLAWATAYTSINSLISAEASFLTTSGNIVYFGHDHNCQATNSANLVIAGPTSGAPVYFISVTQGTTTYQKGTGSQIDTTEGAYGIRFDDSFAVYGLRLVSGSYIHCISDDTQYSHFDDCTFVTSSSSYMLYNNNGTWPVYKDCVFDLSLATPTSIIYGGSGIVATGLSFINAGSENTSYLCNVGASSINGYFQGCDFSPLDSGNLRVASGSYDAIVIFNNCKLPSTYTLDFSVGVHSEVFLHNCLNSGDNVSSLIYKISALTLVSTTSIYRSNGSELEGVASSWGITTDSTLDFAGHAHLPWIYGYLDTTGSKNFDVLIANDSADFDDDEVWLEVEYKATSGSGVWTRVDDAIATIVSTPAAQDDDTSSTWNGTGPSFTYKQRLRVTATVNQIGQFRARVCVAKPSIAAGAYFYIDPLVVVS